MRSLLAVLLAIACLAGGAGCSTESTGDVKRTIDCPGPPMKLHGLYPISDIRFLDRHTLLVSGWVGAEVPSSSRVRATPPAIGPSQWMVGVLMRHQLYRVNTLNQMVEPMTATVPALMRQVCAQCKHEVLSQSPDGKWQLIQALPESWDDVTETALRTGALRTGVWLVSTDREIVVNRMLPAWSRWEWAEDSSALWYVASAYEFGIDSYVVFLDADPLVVSAFGSPADPVANQVVFLPDSKALLSVDRTSLSQIRRMGLISPEISLSRSWEVTGLVGLAWDMNSRQALSVTMRGDTLEFAAGDRSLVVSIPRGVIHESGWANAQADEYMFAVAASGEQAAIASIGELLVFHCVERAR